jgi:hypothetical protein
MLFFCEWLHLVKAICLSASSNETILNEILIINKKMVKSKRFLFFIYRRYNNLILEVSPNFKVNWALSSWKDIDLYPNDYVHLHN